VGKRERVCVCVYVRGGGVGEGGREDRLCFLVISIAWSVVQLHVVASHADAGNQIGCGAGQESASMPTEVLQTEQPAAGR